MDHEARQRQGKQAAPALVLGVLLWLIGGLLATYGTGGPGVLLVGLLGAAIFFLGIVLWVRAR